MSDAPGILVRQATMDDFDAIIGLQRLCFPAMATWAPEDVRSQIARFPQGQLVVEVDGQVMASCAALVVDEAEYRDWHDWKTVADNGRIRNHDPDGDTLYGIEIQVHPAARGQKLSRRLYDARKKVCRDLNLRGMILGGRIPGYAPHREAMSAEDYVRAVVDRRLADPVLTAQLANGFEVRGVVADYLPSDEDSAGYATILRWRNLDHVPEKSRRERRAYDPVRLASVQYQMRPIADFAAFSRAVENYVDTASDYRCDFLVFPELFNLQMLSFLGGGRPQEEAKRLAGMADAYKALFTDLARRYDVNLIGGSHLEHDPDTGLLVNVAGLYRRDGTTSFQRKIHITPAEARWWGVTGGDHVEVMDTDRGKVAILICYDSEFPELARLAVDHGARILFVPFNTTDRAGYMRVHTCAHARCIENHVYAVTAGCVGHLPDVANADLHYAVSEVLTPCDVAFPQDGIAVRTGPSVEEMIMQDLDLEALRRHRARGTVRNWDDRRTDLYRVSWRGREPADV